MRIRITEDQLDKVKEQESYKKMLFKYWDKVGPGLTDTMTKLFASNTLACLTVINTQTLVSYISDNLKLI